MNTVTRGPGGAAVFLREFDLSETLRTNDFEKWPDVYASLCSLEVHVLNDTPCLPEVRAFFDVVERMKERIATQSPLSAEEIESFVEEFSPLARTMRVAVLGASRANDPDRFELSRG